MKKKSIIIVVILVMTLTACKQTDVIGSASIDSFEAVLKIVPDGIGTDEINGGWSLSAPDESARFIWSKDFASSDMDIMIELDAQPFIDAGLDINKLPAGLLVDDKIIVGTNLGNETITYKGDATPLESYKKIVDLKRGSVSYHSALDHYGVNLGEGNAFEWAKDSTKNDKDIVFVLDPQVFIDAGVDPEKVEGWIFAKVETMDMKKKAVEIDKLLKPFDLD